MRPVATITRGRGGGVLTGLEEHSIAIRLPWEGVLAVAQVPNDRSSDASNGAASFPTAARKSAEATDRQAADSIGLYTDS